MSDITRPVVGYRYWAPRDGVLRSHIPEHGAWIAGVNEAVCWADGEPHPAPEEQCQCGLYSYYAVDSMLDWLCLPSLVQDRPGEVFGVTRSWGRVAAGRLTFAAQFSEIIALADSRADPDGLRSLSASYGVPLIARDGLQAWAAEFGDPVSMHLRPQLTMESPL